MENGFVYLLIAINILTIVVSLIDKRAASHGGSRISENTFLLLSVLGGSPGMLISMYLFRHKTRHMKFYLGVPLIMLIQAALLWKFFN